MDTRQQALELLNRDVAADEYQEIRELWKSHSIAEDNRDIAGLMATLTDDCVYEIVPTSHTWEGLAGATRFYTELLTAFPDIKFHLREIVIGPQGVCEEAHVTGTFAKDWLEYSATGTNVEFDVVIFFPWDRERRKFTGERVHLDTVALRATGKGDDRR